MCEDVIWTRYLGARHLGTSHFEFANSLQVPMCTFVGELLRHQVDWVLVCCGQRCLFRSTLYGVPLCRRSFTQASLNIGAPREPCVYLESVCHVNPLYFGLTK